MPSKTTDRLAEIRARVARRTVETPIHADEMTPAPSQSPDDALAAASAHFFGAAEQIIQSRPVQRLPIGQIAPDSRPEMRQARLIPLPDELLAQGQSVPSMSSVHSGSRFVSVRSSRLLCTLAPAVYTQQRAT